MCALLQEFRVLTRRQDKATGMRRQHVICQEWRRQRRPATSQSRALASASSCRSQPGGQTATGQCWDCGTCPEFHVWAGVSQRQARLLVLPCLNGLGQGQAQSGVPWRSMWGYTAAPTERHSFRRHLWSTCSAQAQCQARWSTETSTVSLGSPAVRTYKETDSEAL